MRGNSPPLAKETRLAKFRHLELLVTCLDNNDEPLVLISIIINIYIYVYILCICLCLSFVVPSSTLTASRVWMNLVQLGKPH